MSVFAFFKLLPSRHFATLREFDDNYVADLYNRLLVCFRLIEKALLLLPAEIGDEGCHSIRHI
jgi:hypothetical protein